MPCCAATVSTLSMLGAPSVSAANLRVPDLTDKRAKLVLPTERGQDVIDIAQQFAPELEARITRVLGTERVRALREDLDTIRRTFAQ
jgi:DNA-binding MarR family transcriptional regulator